MKQVEIEKQKGSQTMKVNISKRFSKGNLYLKIKVNPALQKLLQEVKVGEASDAVALIEKEGGGYVYRYRIPRALTISIQELFIIEIVDKGEAEFSITDAALFSGLVDKLRNSLKTFVKQIYELKRNRSVDITLNVEEGGNCD